MSGGKAAAPEGEDGTPKKKGKMKLIIGAVVLLGAAGAGLWFSGVLPRMLGGKPKAVAEKGAPKLSDAQAPAVYVDVPDILTNLNVPGRRQSYVKLHAKLEVGSAADVAPVTAAMPRILDLFQTYLRDMRPEELRGSEGSYRLREELVSRAEVAVAPAQVRGVLFQEMVIQ